VPQRFLFGPVEYLGAELREWHTEGVLILASSRRHLDALEGALGGFAVEIFDGARVHVPAEVVAAAEARLAASGANTIVAIGGGSPIGLGKALRLARPELHFVAVPTTYAGSERTSIYGITSGGEKQTGRDPRVRPDLVVYDPELTIDLPIGLTTQSLCNAIAHVASVMSTSSLPAAADGSAPLDRATAARDARTLIDLIETLIASPRDRNARIDAQAGASDCARFLDLGTPGVQHALAHLLGGAFGNDHAALHSILLPRFLAHFTDVRDEIARSPRNKGITSRSSETAITDPAQMWDRGDTDPAVPRAPEVEAAPPIAALEDHLLALLARAGAPTTLRELGITAAALEVVLAAHPELPGDIARAAL